MPLGAAALCALAAFALLGCLRIPEETLTLSHRLPSGTERRTADCPLAAADETAPALSATALDAGGFSLVSWNIHKGSEARWEEDFRHFSRTSDIVTLQEAYLTDALRQMLEREAYHWDMTAAFLYKQIATGVLTAARTAPSSTCSFRVKEPITRLPKSVLISRYPLTGTDRELLVANIHGVNFTMDADAFERQIDQLAAILSLHRGPIIVAGDFNTWNGDRLALVHDLADEVGLSAVGFDDNRRSRFFGFVVDHVFYRGLEAQRTASPRVSTSDHNPLMVVFKLAPANATGG